jgi:hypothetical protein
VQRCLGEVLAGEGDVKKGERCFLVGPGWGREVGLDNNFRIRYFFLIMFF